MTSQAVERTWIRTGGNGRLRANGLRDVKMIQKRLAGVRFSAVLKTFSLHVFLLDVFLFLMCPFWSGVGYDFRGNYGSI